MRGALLSLVFAIILLLIFFILTEETRLNENTIDIHFHDTYFVTSYAFIIWFLFLFLATFFLIGGVIATRFRKKLFLLLLVLVLGVDLFFIVWLYEGFNV